MACCSEAPLPSATRAGEVILRGKSSIQNTLEPVIRHAPQKNSTSGGAGIARTDLLEHVWKAELAEGIGLPASLVSGAVVGHGADVPQLW